MNIQLICSMMTFLGTCSKFESISINPCMSFSLTWEVNLLTIFSFDGYGFDKENVHCIKELLFGEKEGLI